MSLPYGWLLSVTVNNMTIDFNVNFFLYFFLKACVILNTIQINYYETKHKLNITVRARRTERFVTPLTPTTMSGRLKCESRRFFDVAGDHASPVRLATYLASSPVRSTRRVCTRSFFDVREFPFYGFVCTTYNRSRGSRCNALDRVVSRVCCICRLYCACRGTRPASVVLSRDLPVQRYYCAWPHCVGIYILVHVTVVGSVSEPFAF